MIGAAVEWALDKIIEIIVPSLPPDDMQYCPDCGGTMFDKYWKICSRCQGTGYVPKHHYKNGGTD